MKKGKLLVLGLIALVLIGGLVLASCWGICTGGCGVSNFGTAEGCYGTTEKCGGKCDGKCGESGCKDNNKNN